jgi:cellulose synthase/poly-beta-1,6-N-acetylglucosamine synthase-like glycosyltransferase
MRGYTICVRKNVSTAVIVTVKNDPLGLSQLLSDLVSQTLMPSEVALILAGSDTQSESVIQTVEKKLPLIVHVLPQTATRSEARNKGVELSKSEILVFTDAGCSPEPNWLEELIKPIIHDKAALVSGYTKADAHTSWERAQAHFVLVEKSRIEPHPLPATRNMAVLKEVFEENGGFRNDLNFAEDFEFSRRLRSKGVLSVFAPKALVSWRPRTTAVQFFLMIFRLTAGDMQSGTWRIGHLSMWLRYVVFLSIFLLISSLSSPQNAVFFLLLIYGAYLFFKAFRTIRSFTSELFWFMTLQPLCDIALLAGTAFGLVWRMQARENRDV